jgi:predicted dienelactone hydrolase
MHKYVVLILVGLVCCPAAHAAESVGFREIALPGGNSSRTLDVALWYPTDDLGPQTLVGDNPAFVGFSVAKDAKPTSGLHPLVVMSHGYGGSWRNENWLAGDLARHGYVVSAPDHPGTTTSDKSPSEAKKLWKRPRDLSRVIDALTGNSDLAGGIATKRIAAVGHSLGGWTVLELVGSRFEADRLTADCKTHSDLASCTVFAKLGTGQDAASRAALGGDLRDDRIGAVVSLDLGLARGFVPASLAAIRIPVLVFAAGTNIVGVPAKLESGYLMDSLPAETSRYVKIADATHFSFMQLCKPGAIDMIEEETPGDGIVCKDGGGRDRKAIHREVADAIIAFLAEALPPQ